VALIDISLPIHDGMVVYEGDPAVSVTAAMSRERGDPANVSLLRLGSHTGTHVDAPAHFLAGTASVDALALDVLVGPALVAELTASRTVERADLAALPLQGHTRLLLKTRNSSLWDRDSFSRDYVALSVEAARLLVERGFRLVGIDYLSIEAFAVTGHPVHTTLLGAGIAILEGLDLRRVTPGVYELLCLPLRVAGADGAPCRAVLRG
jgi:arylformamidase